jgi:hypothetical protein
MNINAVPRVASQTEWSVNSSYPSCAQDIQCLEKSQIENKTYEFLFENSKMVISQGMMTRLCQEGHIFKTLVFDQHLEYFSKSGKLLDILFHFGVSKRAFQALVFSLRINDASVAYKYRFMYESIGGFKTIDKYHMFHKKKRDN